MTCLVGKNEAGKTALLKALYRLNPVYEADCKFDETLDYPRQDMARYKREVRKGQIDHALVVKAIYEFELDDMTVTKQLFGENCFLNQNPTLILSKGYSMNSWLKFQT